MAELSPAEDKPVLVELIRAKQVETLRAGLGMSLWSRAELVDGLFAAVSVHKWQCLETLVDGGCPLTQCNLRGQTILHRLVATSASSPDIILRLVQKILEKVVAGRSMTLDKFVNRRCQSSDRHHGVMGRTCLYQAVSAKNISMIKLLLAHGAKPNIRSGFYSRTPIMEAANKGQTELVSLFLENGASPHLLDKGGQTALIYAAQNGKVNTLVQLIEASSKVNLQNHTGNSALMQAAWNGHSECISRLLAAGADVNQTDFLGRSVLRYAVKSRKRDILEMVLEVTEAIPDDLSIGKAVVEQDDVDMLQALLRRGLPITNKSGDSVLHTAAEMGSINCLSVLLKDKEQLGLNINSINDSYGVSPLQRACAYGYHEIVSQLLRHGADPDTTSRDGLTPLFYSMEVLQLILTKTRGFQCIKELLRFGCSVDQKCMVRCRGVRLKFSMTHLSYALVSCNLFAAQMLMAAGAHSYDLTYLQQHEPAEIFPRELLCTTQERDVFIKSELQHPSALYQAARTAVRRALRRDVQNKIRSLPLPEHVKEFLNLSELEGIIAEYADKIERESPALEEEDYEDSLSIEESDVDIVFSSSEDSSDSDMDGDGEDLAASEEEAGS